MGRGAFQGGLQVSLCLHLQGLYLSYSFDVMETPWVPFQDWRWMLSEVRTGPRDWRGASPECTHILGLRQASWH